ncbi:MAG: prepilin-type N-terminal cleavage/methylation domain-containing protein [Candidatus Gracilibacteria bacterium]|nr:prepilin-type N-terminal cleavage/methylation domain-containing protein [Candidatus Peregrinibacteria bacterium]
MKRFFATIWKKHKKGFTLAEVVIASSVFVVVSLIGVTVFVDVMRIQRRVTLENAIYEDARFMMERISREIRYNTVDYEEYYRDAMNQATPGILHGQYFGCYAQRFYNPGTHNGSLDDIGAICSTNPVDGDPFFFPGCVIDKNSLDVNSGQNPYDGNDSGLAVSTDANAFCDKVEIGAPFGNCALGGDVDLQRDELYLINPEGDQKTYMGRKVNTGTGEYSVALLKLDGQDSDNDGISEVWHDDVTNTDYEDFCAEGYDCPSGVVTNLTDNLAGTSGGLYEGFVPIMPLRTHVTDLQFMISPAEDPRKAFAETDPAEGIQQQPHVTVLMTVEPAQSELVGFAGNVPTVTLQSTITSRVYNEVKSYLGKDVCP